jgi:mRNA interferase MazF
MRYTPGDIVQVDFGVPQGSEAGFVRPGVIVSADGWLARKPSTVFVVPITSTDRGFPSHVPIEPDDINGLSRNSQAQVEHLRSVATSRVLGSSGTVGTMALLQIRDIATLLLDID